MTFEARAPYLILQSFANDFLGSSSTSPLYQGEQSSNFAVSLLSIQTLINRVNFNIFKLYLERALEFQMIFKIHTHTQKFEFILISADT